MEKSVLGTALEHSSSSLEHEKAQDKETQSFGIKYDMEIEKNIPPPIIMHLEGLSSLQKLKSRPPQTMGGLKKRIERDVDKFLRYLTTLGYLEADVSYTLKNVSSKQKVIIHIKLGEEFLISLVELLIHDKGEATLLNEELKKDILAVHKKNTANFNFIAQEAQRIEIFYKRRGYPFVDVKKPLIKINENDKTVRVLYEVYLGPKAKIVDTKVEGLHKLNPNYVSNRVMWQRGDYYDQRMIDKTRRKLLQTGLIGSLTVTSIKHTPDKTQAKEVKNEHEVPIIMHIQTTDAPSRALGAGLRFATSEGLGTRLYWSNNNLRGGGEHLGVSSIVSKRHSKAKIEYNLPDFISPQQKLMNDASVTYNRLRAYRGKTYMASTAIQRPFNEQLTGSMGISGESSRLVQNTSIFDAHLASLPLNVAWDKTEDLLNPTQGYRFNGRFTPYYGRINRQKRTFSTLKGGVNFYIPLSTQYAEENPFVGATFLRSGTILAANRDTLPPDKRFYSGGGDSVRGYGYQLLGPINKDGLPMGGMSMAEFGGELRIKTSESIGGVIFTEAGSVVKSKAPSFGKQNLLWGSGIGFRYYTSVGPIRVDIAFPHKRRKGDNGKFIDAPFQFYVSVGQAF